MVWVAYHFYYRMSQDPSGPGEHLPHFLYYSDWTQSVRVQDLAHYIKI